MSKREIGLLGMLSGDPTLGAVGADLYESSKPKLGKHLGQGFMQDPGTGEIIQNPEMRDWYEQERQNKLQERLMMERMLLGLPTRSQATEARKLERLAGEAGEMEADIAGAQDVRSPVVDTGLEFLKGIPGVGRGMATAAEEWYYDDPGEMELRSRLGRFESQVSKMAAGMALTGYEIGERDKWSPYAPGISAEESERRLGNIQSDLGGEAAAIMGTEYEAPEKTQTYPRKTVGGKVYEKRPDGWYEVAR
jgi:hypothetical protein